MNNEVQFFKMKTERKYYKFVNHCKSVHSKDFIYNHFVHSNDLNEIKFLHDKYSKWLANEADYWSDSHYQSYRNAYGKIIEVTPIVLVREITIEEIFEEPI